MRKWLIPVGIIVVLLLLAVSSYNGLVSVEADTKTALFAAHFTEGKDIANHAVLLDIAITLGLKKTEVENMLKSDLYTKDVNQEIEEAAQLRVNSVPFFVINRKYAVSGAQDPSIFLGALEKAYKD